MIRKPAVSGDFYPSDPHTLATDVDAYLADYAVSPELSGELVGIVAPHAGYMYSGPTAAAAYSLLNKKNYTTAVIVSPSHYDGFNGISIYKGDAYQTPLGIAHVDVDLRSRILAACEQAFPSEIGHRMEHAIEVQIPFLLRIHPHARIVPIVMGSQDRSTCVELGKALAAVLAPSTHVVIASSDLSHFHRDETAKIIDKRTALTISEFDPEKLMEQLETGQSEACGGGPIASVMIAAKQMGCTDATILHQCTSGDITGHHGRVVGYLSAAFWKPM